MFVYYNVNPDGYHIPDCVIRAISTATNLSYYDTIYALKRNSTQHCCDELTLSCYERLLDYEFNLPHYLGVSHTVKQIAENFPNNILLIRTDGHLSVSMYGDIYDIWDCSEEIVTDFWIVT